VLGERALDRGLFNPEALRQMAGEHRAGRWNHADRLWLLLNLELWQRIFLDGEQPENVLAHTRRGVLRVAA
jgi:asparagine synthase (glutamine-hydrolysing)